MLIMKLSLRMQCFVFSLFFLFLACEDLAAQDKKKQSRRERIMQRFDKNKDGQLDEVERESIRKLLGRPQQSDGVSTVKREDKIHIPKDYDPKKNTPSF